MDQKMRNAAFVSFGEINSPKALIEEMASKAIQEIGSLDMNLLIVETVTDDEKGDDIKKALTKLKTADFDLLIICIAGWIPSHAVIAITDAYKDKPMILWGLAGDINNGRIITTAAQAGTTALRKVFEDLGYKFRYVYNIIGKPAPLDKIKAFALAAFAAKSMQHTRVGMMGYRDMKLYNTLYEGISLKSIIGTEIDFFEMLEMLQLSEQIEEKDIQKVLEGIKKNWGFTKPVDDEFLKTGIRYFLSIKKIAEQNGFDAVSLKDVDGMKKILSFPPALIFMLLADEMNLCTIPENDVMGAVTQLVVKHLTGQCAAYLEFYEFFETSVLMGVPDYVPKEVVEGKVNVTSAAFGQISGGMLNISTMKTGRLTLARLSNTGDKYTMHMTTGTATLRSWEEAGWDQPAPQLPSLEVELDVPVEEFTQNISGQHYIIAYGDHLQTLSDFCYLKNIAISI